MIQKLLLIFSLVTLFSAPSYAGDQKDFSYRGQSEDLLNLRSFAIETRYRDREIEETCYRQEPYQETICRNETRYRESCRMEPGRQVCRTTPPRTVCRVRGGQRICSTIPGRRECRMEPGRRICQSIPYTERICRSETRYRQVPYTCRRIVRESYEVTVDHIGKVSVRFEGSSRETHDFRATLDNNKNINIAQLNPTETIAVIVDTQRDVREESRTVFIDVSYTIKFFSRAMLEFRGFNFSDVVLGKENKILYLDFQKWGSEVFSIELVITKNNETYFNANLFSDSAAIGIDEVKKTVAIDLNALGFNDKIRKGNLNLVMTLKRDFQGQILTPGIRNEGKTFNSVIEVR